MWPFKDKTPSRMYRIELEPYSYYGENRKNLLKLLRKKFGKSRGFEALERLISQKDWVPGPRFWIIFADTPAKAQELRSLNAKGIRIHDAHVNATRLIEAGFWLPDQQVANSLVRWVLADL